MYASVIPSLPLSLLCGGNHCDLSDWIPEASVLFARARQGLAVSGAFTGLEAGDVILMPASICKEVLKPFARQGIKIRYYKVDRELQADATDIESRIDGRVKALYINHYHGNPAPMSVFRKLCDAHGLVLYEDCAHGLFGRNEAGELLGRVGDISFFSLWKFFPVPNGGVMALNNVKHQDAFDVDTLSPDVDRKMTARLIMNEFARKGLFPLTMIKNIRHGGHSYPEWSDEAGAYDDIEPRGIDPLAHNIISASNPDNIIAARRKHFQMALDRLPSAIEPLNKRLVDGMVPFALPVLAHDKDARNKIFEAMAAKGFVFEPSVNYVYRSFDVIENAAEEFADADYLADRTLCIPVHQMLTEAQMDKMLSSLQEVVKTL